MTQQYRKKATHYVDILSRQRRLLATGGTHTHGRLERVVDPPLESSKRTNHNHTRAETTRRKFRKPDFRRNLSDRLAAVCRLAHLRDERVCRVRDDGADDTGEVTGGEGDTELSTLAVGVFGGGEDVAVEKGDDVLEEEELGHGVGDLNR